MNESRDLRSSLNRCLWGCVAVTLIGGLLCVWAARTDTEQFLRSYLVAFLFWWSVTMGCLGILMLHYLVGGRWGEAARPLLECGSMIMPLTALLFLPVALGVERLYPWADGHDLSPRKAQYLNTTFFHGRAVGYFLVWLVLAFLLHGGASAATSDRPRWRRLLSAGGLVLLILTTTFAAVDWAMSLDPHWYSSIYGALTAVGGALAGLALITLTLAAIACHRHSGETVPARTLGDLGTLLLAFVMLWAYFAFSQFLIIWSGNLPEENVWYVHRFAGGWQWLAVAIVVLQFAVPLFLLLSRDLKRNPRGLAATAALVFVMQYVNLFWTLTPSFHPDRFALHWTNFVIPLALGGPWLALFLWMVRGRIPQLQPSESS